MLLRATLRRASKQEIRTSAVSLKVLSLVVTCHHWQRLTVFWRHRGLPQPRDTGLEQRQQGHLQQQQVQPVRLHARRVLQVSCPGVCTTNQKDIFIIKFLTFLHSTFESIQALVFLSQQIRGCSGQLHVQVWARSYLEWQAALREHVEDLRLRHRLQEVRLWLRPRISEERSGLCSRDLS